MRKPSQGNLFDAEPVTKPAKTPLFVIRELTDKWGLPEQTARSLPRAAAFARLFRFREGRDITPVRRAELLKALAAKVRDGADNPSEWGTKELNDGIAEIGSLLGRAMLARVVKGLAAAIQAESPETLSAPH